MSILKMSSSTETRSKRKLMPLRNHNSFFSCGSPVDEDYSEARHNLTVRRKSCEKLPLDSCRTRRAKPERNSKDEVHVATSSPTLVCTFMHRGEAKFVSQAVAKLGGWEMADNVSIRTTHVICGAEKRTVNLLKGIAFGCWILNSDWVKQSMKVGQWVNEEAYELQSYPGVRQCRIARETFVRRPCNIFDDGNLYYVSRKTSPPYSDLTALLQSCGAKIVRSCKKANVVISAVGLKLSPGVVNVTEKWVLDSIVQNMLLDKAVYLH